MVEVDVAEITFAEALVATHAFELAVELNLDSGLQIADYYPSEKFVECCPNLSCVASAFAFELAVAVVAAVRSLE